MSGTCEVRLTRYYSATPEEVWAALTDPASLTRWLAPASEVALVPGGAFELRLDRWAMKGRVRAVEPRRVLELDWFDANEAPSIVRFELSGDGSGTVLVLDHRQIDAVIGMRYIARWERHLERLDGVLGE